ncbi:MAG TPA: histidine kinase [Albitalea sp.]|uniref:sensor histidine kinase n=1 Tax=Piscinibacter sp. TaxID=1903157 RepID=UPI002ED518BD
MRALFALLAVISMLARGVAVPPLWTAVVMSYLLFAAGLLLRTLGGWPRAGYKRWLWMDAAVLALLCRLMEDDAPWLSIVSVVPVVAMSLLAGPRHAIAMAVVTAAAMVLSGEWTWGAGHMPSMTEGVAMAVLAFGPAASYLSLPNRALRERLALVQTFHEHSDPRRGLLHHVQVLLDLLAAHFRLDSAVISLQGPEPRIFRRGRDGVTRPLDEDEAILWRERRSALPDTAGCLCTAEGADSVIGVRLLPIDGTRVRIDEGAKRVLLDIGPETLALPLMSYGKPLGHLCITRCDDPFTVADLQWLDDCMRELLPLLERSDLLEQLQRESASGERERIGRDLHDSAVQPYLGLKYGLEALARQAPPDSTLGTNIRQLIQLTTQELQNLREVVSGLRAGQDPLASTAFMCALQRQAQRFEALYGLKVHIFAPDALQLRGSAAKAVLHMVNEGLTNVRRHTRATAVTVMLDLHQNEVLVRLRNDRGTDGADADTLPHDFVPTSLLERAIEFGGGVSVAREPNCTEVVITLPMLGSLA